MDNGLLVSRTRFDRLRAATVVAIFAVTVGAAPAALADDAAMAKDAGVGLGSAFASLLYAPAKTMYAMGGLVVGGLAYGFSGGDADVARTVLEPSVLGDYVITPDHLSGDRPVQFFGQQLQDAGSVYDGYSDRSLGDASADVAAAPDGW